MPITLISSDFTHWRLPRTGFLRLLHVFTVLFSPLDLSHIYHRTVIVILTHNAFLSLNLDFISLRPAGPYVYLHPTYHFLFLLTHRHFFHFPVLPFCISDLPSLSVCACDICGMFRGIPPFPSQKASFVFFLFFFPFSLQSLPCFDAMVVLRGWSKQFSISRVQLKTTQSSCSLQRLASAVTGAESVLPPLFLLICSP